MDFILRNLFAFYALVVNSPRQKPKVLNRNLCGCRHFAAKFCDMSTCAAKHLRVRRIVKTSLPARQFFFLHNLISIVKIDDSVSKTRYRKERGLDQVFHGVCRTKSIQLRANQISN